jgi:hypothetical protein
MYINSRIIPKKKKDFSLSFPFLLIGFCLFLLQDFYSFKVTFLFVCRKENRAIQAKIWKEKYMYQ